MHTPGVLSRRLLFSLLIVLAAGAFPERGFSREADTLTIVATLFPQYDFAKTIGGDNVTVTLLLPAGVDPHSFDPRPSDVAAIAGSDIFAYTGSGLEPWAERVIEATRDSGKARAVDLTAGMEFLTAGDGEGDEEHRAGHAHGHLQDPHVWLDPVLAAVMADNLLRAMCEADPAHAPLYTENAAALRDDLLAIDAECRAMVRGAARRTLVFGGRFAFRYFTQRYGLEHIGAYDSCVAGAEPGVRRILEITEYIEKNHIPVIYHEEATEPGISMAIAAATGCGTMTAHSLHNVSAAERAAGVRFTRIMRQNIQAFARGLR